MNSCEVVELGRVTCRKVRVVGLGAGLQTMAGRGGNQPMTDEAVLADYKE